VTLNLDAGASRRDVQDTADHADPRTTRRYDRARYNLHRHPTYALAGIDSNPPSRARRRGDRTTKSAVHVDSSAGRIVWRSLT